MEADALNTILSEIDSLRTIVESDVVGWGTVIPSVLGFFVASVSLAAMYFCEQYHKKKNLKAALLVELNSIASTIRFRGYVEHLRAQAGSNEYSCFRVNVPDDYFIIYKSNVGDIGLLDRDDAEEIVEIYHLLESVVMDVTKGGVLYEGGSGYHEALVQCVQLLEKAFNKIEVLVEKK
ncbi:hypothetical protein MRB56_12585 [Halomonas cupida]|uniref:hypothetical protein n=1 Tax=Halomonas cupida TaxID=44933 RepID=UPI0039B641AC